MEGSYTVCVCVSIEDLLFALLFKIHSVFIVLQFSQSCILKWNLDKLKITFQILMLIWISLLVNVLASATGQVVQFWLTYEFEYCISLVTIRIVYNVVCWMRQCSGRTVLNCLFWLMCLRSNTINLNIESELCSLVNRTWPEDKQIKYLLST